MTKQLPLALCALALVACGDNADPSPEPDPLPDSYVITGDEVFPEGVAYAASERAFFTGSLGDGSVLRLDVDGSETRIFEPTAGWSTLGMKISPISGELVVCAVYAVGAPDTEAEIWSFDTASGARTHVAPLKGAFAGANCNDVAFDTAGLVYVTDRQNPNLYRVSLTDESAELWLTDPLLASEVIGCNGIVVTADNQLLVGKYAPARLLRIPLAQPEAIDEVALSGETPAALPDGFDGISWVGDTLIIAGNSRVHQLTSTDGWATATTTASLPGVNIAAVTVAEGRVYGLKGEIVSYVLKTAPNLPFELRALDL